MEAAAPALTPEAIEDKRRAFWIEAAEAKGYVVAQVVYFPPRPYRVVKLGDADGRIIEHREQLAFTNPEDAAADAYATATYRNLCDKYGEENVMSAVPPAGLAAQHGFAEYQSGMTAFLVPGH